MIFLSGFSRFGWMFALSILLIGPALPVAGQTKEYAVIQACREIGVSFEPSSIAYREYENGEEQDSEHGWIPGVGAKASLVQDRFKLTNLLFDVTYDFNDGSSDHRSKSLTGGSPLHYSAPFRSNDVSFWIGKGFLPTPKLFLTVEAQAEYREWLRQLPQALLAIREDYTFWAPGLALGASYNPLHHLVVKAKAGFGYTISPTNATIGNPTNQTPNLTLALGNRSVWRTTAGADWAITRRFHTFAEANYSHFIFGRSATEHFGDGGSELEPSSVTDLTKVNMGLAWSF